MVLRAWAIGSLARWPARGYRLAIHARHSLAAARQTADELCAAGVDAAAWAADVSVESEVERLVDDVARHFGRLDVLVTAAAIWEPRRLEEVTADEVRRYLDVNTVGTFLCCQKAGLRMVRQASGGGDRHHR